jgi:DNA repair protein RecN (Recombination protein N)
MLTELRIRNFAIIEGLDFSFHPGFVVFSGETGAGKSIIIDAVELLLGARGESTVVRRGEGTALIEGVFRLDAHVQAAVHGILESEGLLDDPTYVTMGREIRQEGRNVCRLNGRTVTLGLLRQIGEYLVDVHGQSEHLSLLRIREHLNLLDRYADLGDLRNGFHSLYRKLNQVRQARAKLERSHAEAESRRDLLEFQVNEIEAAALKEGELAALLEERTRLANAEKLATLAEQALSALDDSNPRHPSASEIFGEAVAVMEDLASVDSSLARMHSEGQALLESMTDIAGQLRSYREQIEFNPRRLDVVEERVALIRGLERKYGGSAEAVLAYAEEARQKLRTLTHSGEQIQKMRAAENRLLTQLGELGSSLSLARQAAALELAAAVEDELDDLQMTGASFGTALTQQDDPDGLPADGRRLAFDRTGVDQAEFLVAPNPGEGLKPLVKTASGGETSRLMLGLKTVLAKADRTPTLIFDEIDQGIGGRVGAVVGYKLWALARRHQVLCVTHLPQLAAFADQHYKVEKHIQDGRTITVVGSVTDQARREELALMLGGISEANLESAANLLASAEEEKETTLSHQA